VKSSQGNIPFEGDPNQVDGHTTVTVKFASDPSATPSDLLVSVFIHM
jgi:hypothetical protein